MGNQNQDLITQPCVKTPEGWQRAISEAERQIKEGEEKVRRLKLSIETFREMLAQGEPFPGEGGEQAESEAA